LNAAALLGISTLLHLGIPIAWCLVFGALISPTDPISVLGVLRRVGISKRLQATMAGESLFNDGVGVVLFTLMLSLASSNHGLDFGAIQIATEFSSRGRRWRSPWTRTGLSRVPVDPAGR
jgi:CPA1 family monovalent cation:H+ antiporter